jgi:hypothetical protein
MNVGIYTRWQRRISTYAAIQIADLMSQWQHDVTILTPTPRKPLVSSFWDKRVRHDSQIRFTDWAATLDIVIWTFCPQPAQPTWVAKAGKRAILVPDWDDLRAIGEAGRQFWRVMAPSQHWVHILKDRGLRNATLCPWSPMLPVTNRQPDGSLKVYVPPVDRPEDSGDGSVIDVVEALFEYDQSVQVTVSMDGRRGVLVKRLENLAKIEPRLTLDRPVNYQQQLLRCGEHSVTLLSSTIYNFGMWALFSLHMGTPIVGFDTQTLDELANPRNSILVPCSAASFVPDELTLLMPADRQSLIDALMLLTEPAELSRISAGCSIGLEQRRLDFEAAWLDAVPREVWKTR